MNTIILNRLSILALAAALVACSVPQSSKDASISHQEAEKPVAPSSHHEVGKSPQEQTLPGKRMLSEAASPQVKSQASASRIDQALAGNSTAVQPDQLRMPTKPLDRENYAHFDDNPVKLVAEHPVSTFSIDVDTGAYANVRRFLKQGRLPVHDAVRVEELINYFSYNYPTPADKRRPFSVTTAIAPAPWDKNRHLLQIGIKGYDLSKQTLPPANLVFLIDVSGSMRSATKLELLKTSLKLLTRQLRAQDRISIVVYAGASGVVLEPVAGDATGQISAALDALTAGGSTNGGDGIRLAYAMAEQAFIKGGINRVLLATDGDFNVGTVNFEALKNLVEQKRKSGIALTTLGFGTGNYNDRLMEQLADAGNGNYAYIDNFNEAQKVLVQQMSATMLTIAKDVKIQIEFNPETVAEYRPIGYENRALRREDFDNDKVDAGEIGAGHTVTALYEVVLQGSAGRRLQPLRYATQQPTRTAKKEELAFLRIRYKLPESDTSELMEWPLKKAEMLPDIAQASEDFRFSAAVAAFGQMLRGGKYTGEMSYEEVAELARNARGNDRFGYRGEFIQLVSLAQSLAGTARQARR
jgi:Ca-activated chloride channel family protein